MIDLNTVKLAIPTAYDDGLPTGYTFKSIARIMQDQNPFELIVVRDWIADHIYRHIGWHDAMELTEEIVRKAFALFETLHIKPTDCICEESEDSNEADEQV